MRKKDTLFDFLSGMDWELLKQQQYIVNGFIARKLLNQGLALSRLEVLQRIQKLIMLWQSFKDKPKKEWIWPDFDWKQLKADKLIYLKIQSIKRISEDEYDALEGILNGIDAWQDAAVDELGLDKHLVFTLTED